jgi:hypothetical protein
MILTIVEDTTFVQAPVVYALCGLTMNLHSNLKNQGFQGDKAYICLGLGGGVASGHGYTGLTFTDISSGSFIVATYGVSEADQYIGQILHVLSGLNKGVYVIVGGASNEGTGRGTFTIAPTSDDFDGTHAEAGVLDYQIANWQVYEDRSIISDSSRMTGDSFLRKNFLAKDMWTYTDEAMSLIKKNFGDDFNNFVTSDLGMLLVEVLSYQSEGMTWYLNFIANELRMKDAKLVSSASDLSRYLNYKPSPMVASGSKIRVTLSEQIGDGHGTVTFPKGLQCKTDNGIIFETAADIVMTSLLKDIYADVAVIQGETIVETFVGSGQPNQIMILGGIPKGKGMLKGVKVFVGETEWPEVDTLEFGSLAQFEVDYLGESPAVIFGSGLTGSVPEAGSVITVYKRIGVGKTGNVSSNVITKAVDTVAGLGGIGTVKFTVTNIVEAVGGGDAESLESIKANAPKFFSTSDRAVTQEDWDTLATTFSGTYGRIAKAKAKVIRGLDEGSPLATIIGSFINDVATISTVIDGRANEIILDNDFENQYGELIDVLTAALGEVQATRDQLTAIENALKLVSTNIQQSEAIL